MITFTDLGLFSYLGNELFQYASMLGVAQRNGYEVRLPPASQHRLGSILDFDTPTYTSEELRALKYRFSQGYPNFAYEPELERIPDNCDLFGYFQSRRHFPDNAREVIRLKPELLDEVESLWATIAPTKPVVGFHVRRGDNVGSNHWLLLEDTDFYERAQAQFDGMDVQFLLVSDDLAWCEENLARPDALVAPPASAQAHLALLARCDHLIMANSSFSWWAAWFQEPRGGTIVAPRLWYHPETFANDEQDFGPEWVVV